MFLWGLAALTEVTFEPPEMGGSLGMLAAGVDIVGAQAVDAPRNAGFMKFDAFQGFALGDGAAGGSAAQAPSVQSHPPPPLVARGPVRQAPLLGSLGRCFGVQDNERVNLLPNLANFGAEAGRADYPHNLGFLG